MCGEDPLFDTQPQQPPQSSTRKTVSPPASSRNAPRDNSSRTCSPSFTITQSLVPPFAAVNGGARCGLLVVSTPPSPSARYYYFYNSGLQAQSVLYSTPDPIAEGEVFFDPNTLSDDGTVR